MKIVSRNFINDDFAIKTASSTMTASYIQVSRSFRQVAQRQQLKGGAVNVKLYVRTKY